MDLVASLEERQQASDVAENQQHLKVASAIRSRVEQREKELYEESRKKAKVNHQLSLTHHTGATRWKTHRFFAPSLSLNEDQLNKSELSLSDLFPSSDSDSNDSEPPERKYQRTSNLASKRAVILERVERQPPYTTWVHLNKSIRVEDEEIMRAIPYLDDNKALDYVPRATDDPLYKRPEEDSSDESEDPDQTTPPPESGDRKFYPKEDRLLLQIAREFGEDEHVWVAVQKALARRHSLDSIRERYNALKAKKEKAQRALHQLPTDSFEKVFCRRCFIYDCNLHMHQVQSEQGPVFPRPDVANYEVYPTEGRASATRHPCGAQCYMNGGSAAHSDWVDAVENDVVDKIFECGVSDFCAIAALLAARAPAAKPKTCAQVAARHAHKYRASVPSAASRRGKGKKGKAPHARTSTSSSALQKFLAKAKVQDHGDGEGKGNIGVNYEYVPCSHDGPCCPETNCCCYNNTTFCEKYCACSADCKIRFNGCKCNGGCKTKVCPCVAACRECDPDTCSCTALLTIRRPPNNPDPPPSASALCTHDHRRNGSGCSFGVANGEAGIAAAADGAADMSTDDDNSTGAPSPLPTRSLSISPATSTALDGCAVAGPSARRFVWCRNVAVQGRIHKRCAIAVSTFPNAGWGLFTLEPIKANDFILEYLGEVVSHAEAERRGKIYDQQEVSYLFDLDTEFEIDGTLKGNKARFINHSPNPNCFAKVIRVLGDNHVCIFAKRDLEAGDELFFNYSYKEYRGDRWAKGIKLHNKKQDKAASRVDT